jgi:hypothetical protein
LIKKVVSLRFRCAGRIQKSSQLLTDNSVSCDLILFVSLVDPDFSDYTECPEDCQICNYEDLNAERRRRQCRGL